MLYIGGSMSGCVAIDECSKVGTCSAIIRGIRIGSSMIVGTNSTVSNCS